MLSEQHYEPEQQELEPANLNHYNKEHHGEAVIV